MTVRSFVRDKIDVEVWVKFDMFLMYFFVNNVQLFLCLKPLKGSNLVFCPYFVLSLAENVLGHVLFCVEHFKGPETISFLYRDAYKIDSQILTNKRSALMPFNMQNVTLMYSEKRKV